MERHTIYHETYYLQKGAGSKFAHSELIHRLRAGPSAGAVSSEARLGPTDKIVLAVCITICNEPYAQFAKTMKCILKNVSLLCQNFDKIYPQNVVVFLIQDGLEKVTPKFLDDAHRKIIRKQQYYSLLEFSSHEKSLAGHPNTVNHQYQQHHTNPQTMKQYQTEGAEAIYEQSSSTSERNFADLDMSLFNSSINPPHPSGVHHHHNISGVSDPEGGNNFVGKGGVIPMTNYAVQKWNESHILHCFYTQASVNLLESEEDRLEVLHASEGRVPNFYLVYGIKESNRGKLDSHRYFFDGFCRELNPRYCILTDCGTQFRDRTYYGFVKMGEMKPLMAGICSEIQTEWRYCRPHVMAQFIEYKIDQVLKSAEGLYGLVQILPGAHQFLKWSAVRGKALEIYCEGTEQHNYLPHKDTLGVFKRNVFLTEDKLITTLIMTREDQLHTINYLAGTKSFTDVPKTTVAILRQRRRWLNGGFSCTIYGFCLFCKDYKNSRMRKQKPCLGALLFLQLLYYLLQIFVQSNIAFEVISFYFLAVPFENVLRGNDFQKELEWSGENSAIALLILFMICTVMAFVLSLFSNTRRTYAIVLFEILNWMFIVLNLAKLCGVFLLYHYSFRDEIESTSSFYIPALPLAIGSIASIILNFTTLFLIRPKQAFCSLHKYLLGFLCYLIEYNTFFYMVKIYLICNYHDVTWGSRAYMENREHLLAIRSQYRRQNILLICVWLAMNLLVIYILGFSPVRQYLIIAISLLIVFQNLVRCIEALIFWWCRYACSEKKALYARYRQPQDYKRTKTHIPQAFDAIPPSESGSDHPNRNAHLQVESAVKPQGSWGIGQLSGSPRRPRSSWKRQQFNQQHSTHGGFTDESSGSHRLSSSDSSISNLSSNIQYYEKFQPRIPALLRVSGNVADSASSQRTGRSTEQLVEIEEEAEPEENLPVQVSFSHDPKQGPQFFKFEHLEEQEPSHSSVSQPKLEIAAQQPPESEKVEETPSEPDTPRLYDHQSFGPQPPRSIAEAPLSEQQPEQQSEQYQISVKERKEQVNKRLSRFAGSSNNSSQFASQPHTGSHMSKLMINEGLQGSEESKVSDNEIKSSYGTSKESQYSDGAQDSLWYNSSMPRKSGVRSGANLDLTGGSLWGQDSGLATSEQEESMRESMSGSQKGEDSVVSSKWFKDSSLVRSEDQIRPESSVKRSRVEEKKITEDSREDWSETEYEDEDASSQQKVSEVQRRKNGEQDQSSSGFSSKFARSSQKQASSGWSYKQSDSHSDSMGEYL